MIIRYGCPFPGCRWSFNDDSVVVMPCPRPEHHATVDDVALCMSHIRNEEVERVLRKHMGEHGYTAEEALRLAQLEDQL